MRVLDWRTLEKAPPPAPRRWRYGLLVEDIEVDGFHCESYGVVVTDDLTGQQGWRRHVTVNAQDAMELLALPVRGGVTPTTLGDVVEDWLGR